MSQSLAGASQGSGIRGRRASLWKKLARGAVLALGRDVAVGRRGKPATPCAIRRNFSTRVLDACNLPLGLRFGGTDATPLAALAFQNSALPFVVAGVPIARDSLLAEAGLGLAIGRNATLGVSYTGQLARNVTDHAAKGKFSWRF